MQIRFISRKRPGIGTHNTIFTHTEFFFLLDISNTFFFSLSFRKHIPPWLKPSPFASNNMPYKNSKDDQPIKHPEMEEKVQSRHSSLQQEYLTRETFDDDDESHNKAIQYLKERITHSRALLRRFKIITVVLFIICLGLVAALSQLLASTSFMKSPEQVRADSLNGNCTSESLSSFMSRYHCDPELQQEEELQQKMDSIVRHIMQGSNDAIVPRFHLKRRDGAGDTPTNHLEGTSALYVDLSKKDNNGQNRKDQSNSTIISTTSSSISSDSPKTSLDESTSSWNPSTYTWTPSSTEIESSTEPEASSSFTWASTTSSSSTESSTTESLFSSSDDSSSQAPASTEDTPFSSSSKTTSSSNKVSKTTSSTEAASTYESSSASSSDESSESSDWGSTDSYVPQTSTDDYSSDASSSTSTTEASSTADSTTPTPSIFSSTSGSLVVMGYTTVVNNTTITSLHTVIASPTSAENTGSASKDSGSSGLSTKDQHIVIGCVVGLGVPIIALIAGAFYWYRRRQTDTTGKNYVDSNGRDVGIAVDGDNILEKLKFWKNNKGAGDFNDDSLDEDFSLDDASESNHDGNGTPQSGESTERSFVVDRAKPIRNQTDHNF